jgi:hypothetical protein
MTALLQAYFVDQPVLARSPLCWQALHYSPRH